MNQLSECPFELRDRYLWAKLIYQLKCELAQSRKITTGAISHEIVRTNDEITRSTQRTWRSRNSLPMFTKP
ncbi:MAG: hypothetical protein KME42_28270 [Tildeniella nuda ZEHNDER 1965/U140]|nr:hypothetical protein [Tildeniella nuda ZEHNDER 1965/U140]